MSKSYALTCHDDYLLLQLSVLLIVRVVLSAVLAGECLLNLYTILRRPIIIINTVLLYFFFLSLISHLTSRGIM